MYHYVFYNNYALAMGLDLGNIVVKMTVVVMGRNLFVANKANIMLMLIPNPIKKVRGETVEVIAGELHY